jgi:hypothetical protein
MDPASLSVIAHAAETVLGVLICLGAPVAFVYTLKHFKLRHRELELDAELHGRQTQARLDSIERRLGVIESAFSVIGRNPELLKEHRSMLEAPATSADEPASTQRDPLRTR